tara:strand:- start:16439 stop:16777 length:339 start_codon:yes stop_codon:yes gene_type:complete
MNDKENKIIALFMGLKPHHQDAGYLIDERKDEGYEAIHESCFLYGSSWDWLMPVVEKIECTHDDKGDCFNVMMEAFECTISGLGLTLCLNGHTKMDATYKAVVEFIKEYNNE